LRAITRFSISQLLSEKRVIARKAGSYSVFTQRRAINNPQKKGHFAVPLDFLRVRLIADLLFRC
jgi:hypothetical protein